MQSVPHIQIDMRGSGLNILYNIPGHTLVCDPTTFTSKEVVDGAMYSIDRSLQAPGLPPAERPLLESLKAQLSDRQSVLSGGLQNTPQNVVTLLPDIQDGAQLRTWACRGGLIILVLAGVCVGTYEIVLNQVPAADTVYLTLAGSVLCSCFSFKLVSGKFLAQFNDNDGF